MDKTEHEKKGKKKTIAKINKVYHKSPFSWDKAFPICTKKITSSVMNILAISIKDYFSKDTSFFFFKYP